jgi:hypothetical protein
LIAVATGTEPSRDVYWARLGLEDISVARGVGG